MKRRAAWMPPVAGAPATTGRERRHRPHGDVEAWTMADAATGRIRLDPGRREISHYLDAVDAAPGLDTRGLAPGSLLVVRTRNTFYTFRLTDPATGACVVDSDGSHVTEETEAGLLGSTLSGRGTMLKMGWVLFDYKLVVSLAEAELVTSRVSAVWIDGRPVVAAPGVC